MRAKHNKKNYKNKDIENNKEQQYEEKYNDVILNKLVPEERKEEFDLHENKNNTNSKPKKNSFKLNLGKKNKKTNQSKKEDKPGKNKKNSKDVGGVSESADDKKSKTKKNKQRPNHKGKGLKNKTKNSNKKSQLQNKSDDINIKEVQDDSLKDNLELDEDLSNYRGDFTENDEDDSDIVWSDENLKN